MTPRRFAVSTLVAAALVLAAVVPAAAQPGGRAAATAGERRLELGAMAGVAGVLSLGDADAALRANGVEANPYLLFSSETRVGPAAIAGASIGYRLTPRLTAEGRLLIGRPTV